VCSAIPLVAATAVSDLLFAFMTADYGSCCIAIGYFGNYYSIANNISAVGCQCSIGGIVQVDGKVYRPGGRSSFFLAGSKAGGSKRKCCV
jgi:hypothetical protein